MRAVCVRVVSDLRRLNLLALDDSTRGDLLGTAERVRTNEAQDVRAGKGVRPDDVLPTSICCEARQCVWSKGSDATRGRSGDDMNEMKTAAHFNFAPRRACRHGLRFALAILQNPKTTHYFLLLLQQNPLTLSLTLARVPRTS